MEALSMKMAFGFLIMFSTWTSFISCKPQQQQQQQQQQQFEQNRPQADIDVSTLKAFVGKIKYRISLGEDVAKYKWMEGGAILDQAREKAVLDSVEKMATGLGFSFKPEDRLFFIDLMEATKLVEYVLVSNWYGGVEMSPKQSANLIETRDKISGMQKGLIEMLYRLKSLQQSDDCQSVLSKAIAENGPESPLLRLALQRAFGNYCYKNIAHK